jgi:hypothetical protein
MNLEELQRIKERIAKLLAMAKDASSPNEAAIAAQRARALMDKYQIDEYDVSEVAPHEFSHDGVTRAFAALPYHINILSVAVALYNDCQSILVKDIVKYRQAGKARLNSRDGRSTKHVGCKIVFRGHKEDVELAKQMLDRLLQNIDQLCKQYMQANHPGKYNVRIGGEYKAGAARALCAKFKEMTVERQQLTSSAGTSLVIVKSKRVDEHFGDVNYRSTSKSIAKGLDSDAIEDQMRAQERGWVDGNTIEITKRLDD